MKSILLNTILGILLLACSIPPVVIHSDRTGNKPLVCFKKACRKKTHQHNMRLKAAKERFKERQRRLAAGDSLGGRAVSFNKLVEADKQKNIIESKPTEETVSSIKWEENKTFVLNDIYFEVSSSGLKTESYDQLDELADWLTKNKNSIIEMSGYTDNTGNENFNLKLSKDRVKSVENYLVKVRGIKKNRILTKGYGSQNPVADNDTEAGRQKNRRVEFTILKK